MLVSFDTENLNGISIDSFLGLLGIYLDSPITQETYDNLNKENYLFTKGEENNFTVFITEKGKKAIEDNLSKKALNKLANIRFEKLAIKLQEIFPKGKKPGTNCMWRDSKSIITLRLHNLFIKFNLTNTDEEVISAAQKYVNSFNGDYKFMQVLKYFICKKDNATGELSSQLLSYLENKDANINDNDDWNIKLI